jgi:two-component system NtrC family response regulator
LYGEWKKMKEHKILVVDDEEWIRNQMKWALSKEYEVLLAGDVDLAMRIIAKEKPEVIMLDISLTPDMGAGTEGIKMLQDILSLDNTIKVIMITGNDTRENARRCVALGAYDFYSKPIEMEELKISIKRALHIQSLERENKRLQADLEKAQEFREIITGCKQMEDILNIVRRVAVTDATVLIQGESGTGKELIARAIHYNSNRKDEPFIPVNCGAIPENLLESELFGHEKGAFTDAHVQRKGKLELAQNGTVFLDEIAELTTLMQVKILRFLQDRQIERVGGQERIQLNIRVIAATNKNISEEIKKSRFREDLYYRLNVISIYLPPLRERGEDVILLANAFLNRLNREANSSLNGFSDEALEVLKAYNWPGNIRELENKVRSAIILSRGAYITPDDLKLTAPSNEQTGKLLLKDARDLFESRYITEALQKNKGNVTNAAKQIGISRSTLHDLMDKYGIDAEKYQEEDSTFDVK